MSTNLTGPEAMEESRMPLPTASTGVCLRAMSITQRRKTEQRASQKATQAIEEVG